MAAVRQEAEATAGQVEAATAQVEAAVEEAVEEAEVRAAAALGWARAAGLRSAR